MVDGWTCPSCGRGVAPGEKYCEHGNLTYLVPALPSVHDCACPPGQQCCATGCPRMKPYRNPGWTGFYAAIGKDDPGRLVG